MFSRLISDPIVASDEIALSIECPRGFIRMGTSLSVGDDSPAQEMRAPEPPDQESERKRDELEALPSLKRRRLDHSHRVPGSGAAPSGDKTGAEIERGHAQALILKTELSNFSGAPATVALVGSDGVPACPCDRRRYPPAIQFVNEVVICKQCARVLQCDPAELFHLHLSPACSTNDDMMAAAAACPIGTAASFNAVSLMLTADCGNLRRLLL
jgi:hypothetical protein